MNRLVAIVLSAAVVVMLALAGAALLVRPTPSAADSTAWGDLCLYPMNRPPGVCVNLPNRLPVPKL